MFGSFTGWAASPKKPNLVEYSDHSYGAFLEYGAGLSSTVNYVRLSAADAAVLAVDRLPATPPATDVFISVARPDVEEDNDISDDNIQHLTDPYENLSVHVWPATAEGVQHYVIYPSISCFRSDIYGIKNGSVDYSVTS